MALYENKDLYESLKNLGIFDADVLDAALKESKERSKVLGEVLLNKDLISDDNLGKFIAEIISVPFVNLSETSIDDEILKLIPEIVAKKQKVIAFKKEADGISLAMADPKNIQSKEFLEKKLGTKVKVYLATERDLSKAFYLYTKDVSKAFEEIIKENVEKAKGRAKKDPPIIKIVDTIISYAYKNKASDIHIEPYEKEVLVRFRTDGILHDIVDLPVDLHEQIVTRIKVLAGLRTDEHQAAQDGKINWGSGVERLDIRVSITPITSGEKVVMRLLSDVSRQFVLGSLGLSDKNLEKIRKAYKKPYGMILSTGPTGCGKTMTMYTILKILNSRDVNIMTIEDPVEYDIEGINQIQVNTKTNLTFAKGLRSIVRQDPDIILVGEVRDEETADIAINSAMTGHLVLSTLHTNDAATSIPRFMDMGVEAFLIASSINVVIAQRLVRKICPSCRMSNEINPANITNHLSAQLKKKVFGTKKKIRVYKGKGCGLCHNTGYKGRTGIFEVLEVDDDIRQAVVQKKNAADITKVAVKNGMIPMIEDGLSKVTQGVTTIEEVIRVTKE